MSSEDNTIYCDIVSAHREIFSGKVSAVFASGVAGELGIYPRHAPIFTQLKPGSVRVKDEAGEEQLFVVSGGILEVQPHVVTVLADTVVRGEELDRSAAEAAKAEALAELAGSTAQVDITEAEIKLRRAVAELQALDQLRKAAKR